MIPTADQLELREEIGVGAVATVRRAVDRNTGHAYAVKILHERNARDPTAARRFAREVELARTLRSANIVAVYGALELDGRQALLMELVEGPTLAELIAREAGTMDPGAEEGGAKQSAEQGQVDPGAEEGGAKQSAEQGQVDPGAEEGGAKQSAAQGQVDPLRLLERARDLARGLAVAHAGGVIHRDLKPANVLIAHANSDAEIAKIADFGMARATSFAGVDREAMTVLGTPDYMAPETLDPLAVDPRTDLYALGCIMLEMASGRPPFAAPTPFAVLEAHRTKAPPSLPDRYGAELRELVLALLEKRPGDRPHAASAVIEVLDVLILRHHAGADTSFPGGTDPPRAARALALARPRDLLDAAELVPRPGNRAVSGRCARCGAPIVIGVRVCLECGLLRVAIERGRWSVFVTGPGEIGDKLDNGSRDRLLTWVRANPDSGLGVGTLAQRIPRLPFPLVVRISEASAQALAASLISLGIAAEARRGGRLAHGGMMDKMIRIGARRGKVALPLLIFGLPLMLLLLLALLPLLPVYLGVVAWWISRPSLVAAAELPASRRRAGGASRRRAGLGVLGFASALRHPRFAQAQGPAHRRPLALPPQVDEHLRTIERKVPQLGPRHRPQLRAVVQRVLALLEGTPESQRAEVDAEMAHALNVATVAAERMDELDAIVSRPDFDSGDPEQREDLRERDKWAARMLELSATLDVLVARQTAARQVTRGAELEHRSELDELRDRIEALEEIRDSVRSG